MRSQRVLIVGQEDRGAYIGNFADLLELGSYFGKDHGLCNVFGILIWLPLGHQKLRNIHSNNHSKTMHTSGRP